MACMHLGRTPTPLPLGVTKVTMPSLFQFSAVHVAFAVDYSKDFGFEDGVVDSPPTKVAKLNYAPSTSPSPLLNKKHVRNPWSTIRLCIYEPQMMSRHLRMSLSCLYLVPPRCPRSSNQRPQGQGAQLLAF